MEITPVIPDGYQGLITQHTCRICKHLFALTASDAERCTDVSYCHACSLILREELAKQQKTPSMLPSASASAPAPKPLSPEPVVPLEPPRPVARFVAQKPSLPIPQPRTIDREKMTVDQLLKEASMLTQTWRYREALLSYEQALMREPGCLAARSGKGVVLQKLHRFPEALAVYELMLDQDPTAIPTWMEKGWILVALRRYEEALATFDLAPVLTLLANSQSRSCLSLLG